MRTYLSMLTFCLVLCSAPAWSAEPNTPEESLSKDISDRVAVKISSDASGRWTIMQGFTWIPETRKFYTAWDSRISGKSAVVIMRHNENGDFELKSADISSLINHGQDLGHAFYNGELYLFSSNPNHPGITVFTPPTVEGGALEKVRQFNLLPAPSWGLVTTGESKDARSVVTYSWNSQKSANPQFVTVFDFKKLMDGPDGDRFDDYTAQVNISPRDEYWSRKRNTIQSVTSDSSTIYVLTSADRVTDPKYLSAFDMHTGQRKWRKELSVGQLVARSRGPINEYEGMAWIPGSGGTHTTSLWTGVRMRTAEKKGNEMFIMPIPQQVYSN